MKSPLRFMGNAQRVMSTLFPGYFPEAKHNHYTDFGYPLTLGFQQYHSMYSRNSLATAAVNKTASKVWQENPQVWESDNPEESVIEIAIRQRFEDLRIWQALEEADAQSMVGGYSGVILRLADNQEFSTPVGRVQGGLEGLAEVIPAWAGQLTVSEYNSDHRSADYGKPTMFQFVESNVQTGSNTLISNRTFSVHPSRVIVWSKNGTINCPSLLEPGFNDLLTLEKVSGAGGEGFWKNARNSLSMSLPKDARINDMAKAMGVTADKVFEAINDQVDDFQRGFDKALLTQGMEIDNIAINLPSPEHFFNIALQSFAASVDIPLKVLVGNQTGERASTEDARSWNNTCMSRRKKIAVPNIKLFLNRLEQVGVLPKQNWIIDWGDLTESSTEEKIALIDKMAGINQKMKDSGEFIFTPEEMREVANYDPLTDEEKYRNDQNEGDGTEADPNLPELPPTTKEEEEDK